MNLSEWQGLLTSHCHSMLHIKFPHRVPTFQVISRDSRGASHITSGSPKSWMETITEASAESTFSVEILAY